MTPENSDFTATPDLATTGSTGQYLQFRIAGLLLCAPLSSIERVLPLVQWQPLPGGAAFLRGLLNLHGEAVPVIDLAERLGHRPSQNYRLDTPILLCRAGDRVAGLVVREIMGIVDLETGEGQVRQLFESVRLPFEAAFDTASGLTMLINIGRVLDFRLDQDSDEYAEAAAEQLRALG